MSSSNSVSRLIAQVRNTLAKSIRRASRSGRVTAGPSRGIIYHIPSDFHRANTRLRGTPLGDRTHLRPFPASTVVEGPVDDESATEQLGLSLPAPPARNA